MSDPKMSNSDVTELYQRIGKALVAAAPQGWSTVAITYFTASTTSESHSFATMETGSIEFFADISIDLDRALHELRRILYQDGKGAWYIATVTVTRDGKIDIHFDYDTEPAWDIPVVPLTYVEDLKKFPRNFEHQPAWLQEKIREVNA